MPKVSKKTKFSINTTPTNSGVNALLKLSEKKKKRSIKTKSRLINKDDNNNNKEIQNIRKNLGNILDKINTNILPLIKSVDENNNNKKKEDEKTFDLLNIIKTKQNTKSEKYSSIYYGLDERLVPLNKLLPLLYEKTK